MRLYIMLLCMVCSVGAWELTLDASCDACGYYQKSIVLKPGVEMAPCQYCGRVVTKMINRTIGGGECKACHSLLTDYPEYLWSIKWWQATESDGEVRRSTPAIFLCPSCGNQTLRFVCTKRKP